MHACAWPGGSVGSTPPLYQISITITCLITRVVQDVHVAARCPDGQNFVREAQAGDRIRGRDRAYISAQRVVLELRLHRRSGRCSKSPVNQREAGIAPRRAGGEGLVTRQLGFN